MTVSLILFYLVIFLSNIIQAITGFAGTLLAMPPSLMLVGYEVAKPILNLLGLLASITILVGSYRFVEWHYLKKAILGTTVGIVIGLILRPYVMAYQGLLLTLLALMLFFISLKGFSSLGRLAKEVKRPSEFKGYLLLVGAGIVHSFFVVGGPLVVSYFSSRISDKRAFRATISTVWVFLNTIILVHEVGSGQWSINLLKILLKTLPFWWGGMVLGKWLYGKMDQKIFTFLTYVLLFISGIFLLIK